jgi:hypothetical protein
MPLPRSPRPPAFNGESSFTRESYDAAALIALAMHKGGARHRSEPAAANILDIANAPGEPILPGELGKALQILNDGGEIDYVGATNVELIGPGEAAGTYREYRSPMAPTRRFSSADPDIGQNEDSPGSPGLFAVTGGGV